MSRVHSYNEDEVSLYYIKEYAAKAWPEDGETFERLIAYFRRWLVKTRSEHREILLTAGILTWIVTTANMTEWDYEDNTPIGLVRAFVQKEKSGTEVLSEFLRHAKIEFELIDGREKPIRYRAGDPDSSYIKDGHTWMAFKENGKWHLLHPTWAMHKFVGLTHGDELKIEASGVTKVTQVRQQDGKSTYGFNDFWFCTRPDIFVNRCFPDDPSWQSPNTGIPIVNSVNEFLDLPDFRKGFYKMSLGLLSEKKCVLTSLNGRSQVVMKAESCKSTSIDFSYELVLQDTGSISIDQSKLKQLVLPQIKDDTNFVFDVRFPVTGTYWLRLFVGDHEAQNKMNCCAFKIKCVTALENCQLYPSSHGLGMFGYSQTAQDAGLDYPCVPGAKLKTKPGTGNFETVQTFACDGNLDVDAAVYDDDKLEGCARTMKDKDLDKVDVQVKLPPYQKECSLVVSVKGEDDDLPRNVAVYMVNANEDDITDNTRDKEIELQEKRRRAEVCIERKIEEKEHYEQRIKDIENEIKSLSNEVKGLDVWQQYHGNTPPNV